MTLSLDGHVRINMHLMRSYINRSFFRNTLKVIQLSVLFHILTKSTNIKDNRKREFLYY